MTSAPGEKTYSEIFLNWLRQNVDIISWVGQPCVCLSFFISGKVDIVPIDNTKRLTKLGRGCGSVGSAFAFESSGPLF